MVIWREVHWVWTLCIEPGKCHTNSAMETGDTPPPPVYRHGA